MANAKKCDRCGEYYTPHFHKYDDWEVCVCDRTDFKDSDFAERVYPKDFCDDCHEKLIRFVLGEDLINDTQTS